MVELIKELQSVEDLNKPVARAYIAENFFDPKSKGKKKQKKKSLEIASTRSSKKPKGKCFHYKQSGH